MSCFPRSCNNCSRPFVSNPKKEERIIEIKEFDDSYFIVRPYEIGYPHIDIIIDNDEQVIEIGSQTLTFYLAPGHNADGMFTLIDHLGVLIIGNYLSDVEIPYIHQNTGFYEESLQKINSLHEQHRINVLIPFFVIKHQAHKRSVKY